MNVHSERPSSTARPLAWLLVAAAVMILLFGAWDLSQGRRPATQIGIAFAALAAAVYLLRARR